MSEEKKYTLEEKKAFYNSQTLSFANEYVQLFEDATNAFVNKSSEFYTLNREIHQCTQRIVNNTHLLYDKVCMFAFSFTENSNLLSGKIPRKSRDHIYFIESNDAIKIGRSINVNRRLSQLQIENAHNLSKIGMIHDAGDYERPIHRIFDYIHIRGEWFKKHPDIYSYIKSIVVDSPIKFDTTMIYDNGQDSYFMMDFNKDKYSENARRK